MNEYDMFLRWYTENEFLCYFSLYSLLFVNSVCCVVCEKKAREGIFICTCKARYSVVYETVFSLLISLFSTSQLQQPQGGQYNTISSQQSQILNYCCISHTAFKKIHYLQGQIIVMASFGELVLVLGDLHIPKRESVIPEKFKR